MNAKSGESSSYEEDQSRLISTLNHLRHDWMNDLQVLLGYVQLKKYDRLVDYIDKIKKKMTEERRITGLGIPNLIFFLMSFRIQCDVLELEVGLPEEVDLSQLPTKPAELINLFTQRAVDCYVTSARLINGQTNILKLQISVTDDAIQLQFSYRGACDPAALQRAIAQLGEEFPSWKLDWGAIDGAVKDLIAIG